MSELVQEIAIDQAQNLKARALHRCIHVLDKDASIAFYQKALGMDVVRRKGPEDGSGENIFMANQESGFELELTWNNGRVEPYVNGGRDTHLAFSVADINQARALHEQMGCVCFVNEAMGLYFIEDPDGCCIEILQEKQRNLSQAGTDVLAALRRRRSVRQYGEAPIAQEALDQVIEAGLRSAAGRGIRPWELVVVKNREVLDRLAQCREAGSAMLTGADAAVVVVADPGCDTWIEDCSIVMANMHLEASALGLGSCWIQGRGRTAADGRSTKDFVFDLLGIPGNLELEAILSLGSLTEIPEPRGIEDLWSKVHQGAY